LSVYDYDGSGTINAGEVIKFIEMIAELNDGLSAVNMNVAKSIAEQIMKTCNKQKDGVVKKVEFINWETLKKMFIE
jgi:Ca2+-binding EF-hand superfamily protein